MLRPSQRLTLVVSTRHMGKKSKSDKTPSDRPPKSDDLCLLEVSVVPNAGCSEVVSAADGGGVKVRLAAPPVDGEANKELVRFLSKSLGVPKSSVSIAQGLRSRNKLVRVEDLTKETALGILLQGP